MSDPTAIKIDAPEISTDPFRQFLSGYSNHGGGYIQMPFITKVADNLYHGGVQRGLVLPQEIDFVLSLYPWETYTTNNSKVEIRTVKMYDSLDQGFDQIEELAEWVNNRRKLGNVLVHCQAGMNRSSLVIARALYLNGEVKSGAEAIEKMRAARSPAILTNPAFEAWVRRMGEDDSASE